MMPRAVRRGRGASAALTFAMLLACALACGATVATADAAAAATAAAVPGAETPSARDADEKVYAIRVVDANAKVKVPRVVTGTTRRPGILKLSGHGRIAMHKMFHHLTLKVHDEGGFAANNCALRKIVATSATGKPNAIADAPADASGERPRHANFRDAKIRQRKGAGWGHAHALNPALEATFGPYVSDVMLTPRCEKRRGDGVATVKYRVELVSSKGPDLRRVFRLVVGAALVAFAPTISGWTAAYYGLGMALSVLAVALLVLFRVSRAMPGGRVVKTGGAVVAALAAVIVPTEDLSRIVEGYVALMLKPAQLVFRAVVEQNPDEAGLPFALFATTLVLVGAGVGFWVVRRWLVDPFSGGVEPTVAGFSCAAMRAIGIVLLLFSTLDTLCGAALAGCGVAVAVVSPVISRMTRLGPARGSSGRGRPSSGRDSRRGGSSSGRYGYARGDDFDLDDDASPRSHGRGGSGGGARRRVRCVRQKFFTHLPVSTLDRVPFQLTGELVLYGMALSFGFGGGDSPPPSRGRDRARDRDRSPGDSSPEERDARGSSARGRGRGRKRRSFPKTMDPEPEEPHAVLEGAGLGAEPDDRPRGAGLLRFIGGLLFRRGKRGKDSRATPPPPPTPPSVTATPPSATRGRGRGAKTPFAPVVSPSPTRGKKQAAAAAKAPPKSPPPPVGMAAASVGRFLSQKEYDHRCAKATDTGLGALYGTPEFTEWMKKQGHRLRIARDSDSDYSD